MPFAIIWETWTLAFKWWVENKKKEECFDFAIKYKKNLTYEFDGTDNVEYIFKISIMRN